MVRRSKKLTLGKECPFWDFFWTVFSCIQTEYGEILHIFPYLVRMWENVDQRNSEYRHFSHSVNSNIEVIEYLVEGSVVPDKVQKEKINT